MEYRNPFYPCVTAGKRYTRALKSVLETQLLVGAPLGVVRIYQSYKVKTNNTFILDQSYHIL